MKDYVRGAFEALSWVYSLLDGIESEKDVDRVKKAVKEVDSAMDDIRDGVAVDFRYRLRSY